MLDQFSRNLCRDIGDAYAQGGMAVLLAQEAVKHPDYAILSPAERALLLMPFMHSESAVIHVRALPLFEALGNEKLLDYEARHRELIDTFGRYPYRNAVLGRTSTPEEIEYLQDPNAEF